MVVVGVGKRRTGAILQNAFGSPANKVDRKGFEQSDNGDHFKSNEK